MGRDLVLRMLLPLLTRIIAIGAGLRAVNFGRRLNAGFKCGVVCGGARFSHVCCDYAAMFTAPIATYEAFFVVTSLANRLVCLLALALVIAL